MPEIGDAQPQTEALAAVALQAKFEQAVALHQQQKLADAERIYRQVLQQQPNHFGALHHLGVIALDTQRTEQGADLIRKAIGLNATVGIAHCSLGKALLDLKRPKEALASCDKAIALAPDLAMAHNNRGKALFDLRCLQDAVASYDEAITLKPDFAMAHANRGAALSEQKRSAEALASYDKAIALEPNFAEAYYNRGKALDNLQRYDEAFFAYEKAYAIRPNLTGAEGDRLHAKMLGCDWSNFDSECAHLIASVRSGDANSAPFAFLMVPSSSNDQLQCAKLWVANKFPPSDTPIWQGERYDHNRIRIAYLSPDFHEHATSFLMAGMFECRDKSRFELTAISWGPDDNSATRRRLKASFDHFVEARAYSDDQIAALIRSLEIDLLIDLKGFTQYSRTSIFARRPAPIQINYLGYPGTMGAPYIDYIVADRIVIPEDQRKFYAEKIAYLPNSYQVNDAKRSIADKEYTSAELGLPLMGFVFCCFNNNYKITPTVFDCWMRMLKQVEGSVLWLLEDNSKAANNLRKEAAVRGVNAERLIFAQRMPLSDHLARHRLADLFLDTLPCNAHTTASDALWAGLPVLIFLGETFAGRVAASLLNAVGLPELITTTIEAYEQTAIDLAMHPEKLAIIRQRLADNRLTAALFDTQRSTRHIEAAYTAMYERHRAGLAPDHIFIPNEMN
jgi:protein O-GlcNAc transferase